MAQDKIDITITNEESIFTFRPNTAEGQQWLEDHTDGQWFGGALIVEHRYARDLAQGCLDAGLTVE
jgi:hypothetical protein